MLYQKLLHISKNCLLRMYIISKAIASFWELCDMYVYYIKSYNVCNVDQMRFQPSQTQRNHPRNCRLAKFWSNYAFSASISRRALHWQDMIARNFLCTVWIGYLNFQLQPDFIHRADLDLTHHILKNRLEFDRTVICNILGLIQIKIDRCTVFKNGVRVALLYKLKIPPWMVL